MAESPSGSRLTATELGELAKMLEGPDKEGLDKWFSCRMSNVGQNEATKAALHHICEQMGALSYAKGTPYLKDLSEVLLSLSGLRDIAFGREQYALLIALAKSWMALGAYDRAFDTDIKVFNVPPNMEKSILPTEMLECIVRLLESSKHIRDSAVTGTVLFRAMPQYRRACRQLTAAKQVEAARPVLLAFLLALGASQQRSGLFTDASRTFAERFERSRDDFDFERAVACALLAETGPQRTRLIELFTLAPESRNLRELGAVLVKAFHAELLRRKDVMALSQCKAVTASAIPVDAVRSAVNQHNIMAVSKLFDNISCAALAQQLDGMEAAEVGAAVAKMVSEKRLKARVDQASQWITFRVPDSDTAMTEWDGRLGTVCNAMSHATELITSEYPNLRCYLQEDDG